MTTRRLLALVIAACFVDAAAPSAQTTYVSASLFGDIVRTSHSEASLGGQRAGGETMGFALRLGTPIGATWGVEAEFARPGQIEGDGEVPLLAYSEILAGLGIDRGILPTLPTLPTLPARLQTAQRHTTFTASVWAQQVFTSRLSLVYLGGLGFFRSERELSFSYPQPLPLPVILPPIAAETITYGVRPMAGVEARVSLTDNAYLVPGIRLNAIDDGWLVRPSVGIGWGF